MMIYTPRIHIVQDFVGLMNDVLDALVEDLQILVRHNAGHLQDLVRFIIQARHLHVNPNQVRAGHLRGRQGRGISGMRIYGFLSKLTMNENHQPVKARTLLEMGRASTD